MSREELANKILSEGRITNLEFEILVGHHQSRRPLDTYPYTWEVDESEGIYVAGWKKQELVPPAYIISEKGFIQPASNKYVKDGRA